MEYFYRDLYPTYPGFITDDRSKMDEDDEWAVNRESNNENTEKSNIEQTPTKNILIALVIIILMVIFLGIGG